MAYPVKDTPFTAHHLMAALFASEKLRLSFLGKLGEFQRSRNHSGRKLTEREELALMNELSFTVEVGVTVASEGSATFDSMVRTLTALQLSPEDRPMEHEVTRAAIESTKFRDELRAVHGETMCDCTTNPESRGCSAFGCKVQ